MSYYLGESSLRNLRGVHPHLQAVVMLAITLTGQDFTVFEGIRTRGRQRMLKRTGKSKTLNSRHIPIETTEGYPTGHAVDCPAWIKGRPVWDAGFQRAITRSMLSAAAILGVDVESAQAEWGWDVVHYQLRRVSPYH